MTKHDEKKYDDGFGSLHDAWEVMVDPNHWFAMTDGMNTITVEHLSNGESLPAVAVADNTYAAVYQAYVSTRNEVFAVKGSAVQSEDLAALMEAISTIKILRFDTKSAVTQQAAAAPSIEIVPVNKTFYVIGDEVNVRLGCSIDDQAIGTKYYGEEVQVTGTVQKDGAALGWSQISFNNTTAYISSAFLSEAKPQARTSSAGTASIGSSGSTGSSASNSGNYAIEPLDGTQDPSAPGQAYCIYCGQYYPEGNIFRNHVCPRRDEAYAGYAIEPLDGTQDPLAGN